MTFANLAALLTAVDQRQTHTTLKATVTNAQALGFLVSSWRQAPIPATAPIPPTGAGEALDRTHPAAIPITPAGEGHHLHVVRIDIIQNPTGSYYGGFFLFDRLVHTSGLSALVTTEQAVATAALPARAGGGDGVELYLEGYATPTVSSTGNITARYTNSSGVANRVTQARPAGSVGRISAMLRLPLQEGDVGVRSVEGVTLDSPSGSAGTWGVTLAKRITTIPVLTAENTRDGGFELGLPLVDDAACLFWAHTGNSGADASAFDARLHLAFGT